jgi:16S rRNA (uracil1498-N3)-methyltransferase
LIGPEAGFSVAELKLLEDAGARFVSLGSLVLRTETAALVAAAVVMHRLGELG